MATVRKAHKVWGAITAGVFCLVAISDLSTPEPPVPAATTVAAPSPVAAPLASAPASAPAARPGQVAGTAQPDGDRD